MTGADFTPISDEETEKLLQEALAMGDLNAALPPPVSLRPARLSAPAAGSNDEFKTPGLKRFLAKHGADFEAATFIEDMAPNLVLKGHGTGKVQCNCPNADAHSVTPDGFFAENASARDSGFMMHCSHTSCLDEFGGDRAKFLDSICQQYNIAHADELLQWCPAAPKASAPQTPQTSTPPSTSQPDIYVSRCLADIPERRVEWLWERRIPLGMVGLIAGPPKRGKSQITCALAAAITTGGKFPDGADAPRGSVIMIQCEDDFASTVRPRLEAAGADLTKVHTYDWTVAKNKGTVARLHFDVQQHTPELVALIKEVGDVLLIVIDPVSAYLGKTDSHKAAEVRGALAPLQHLAQEYGVTVAMIAHPNKNRDNKSAMDRVSGSGAFVAVARWNFLVDYDPEDGDPNKQLRRRYFAPMGSNIGDDAHGFWFYIRGAETKQGNCTSRVEFEQGAVVMDTDEMIKEQSSVAHAKKEAADFLRNELADGEPHLQADVCAKAVSEYISEKTLRRAAKEIGVRAQKEQGVKHGRWYWQLPANSALGPGATLAQRAAALANSLKGVKNDD